MDEYEDTGKERETKAFLLILAGVGVAYLITKLFENDIKYFIEFIKGL